MNIPQEAIDRAASALAEQARTDGHLHSTVALTTPTVEFVLAAALPHLLADYRERLVKASAEMGHLADARGEMDNHYFRAAGKIQGVDLALSYLDEMLRP